MRVLEPIFTILSPANVIVDRSIPKVEVSDTPGATEGTKKT